MKRTGMDSDMLYVPEEIVNDILKRLPVISLIRFQFLYEYWKTLIKNPSLIADHLQQSSHQNPCLFLRCILEYNPLRWSFRMLDCGLQLREFLKAPLIDLFKRLGIAGSCNSLLCVEIYEHDKSRTSLSLWNPSTTAVRHVPRNITDYFDSLGTCMTGFGFSPIVNDYNIVITYDKLFGVLTRVEVFSLSRGSWKGIDIGNLKGVKLESESVTVNGAIFWFGIKLIDEKVGEDDVQVVVSFDIAKEIFTVMLSIKGRRSDY